MGTAIYRRRAAEHPLPASAPFRAPRSTAPHPAPLHRSLARTEATTTVKRGIALADSGLLDAAMRLLDQVVLEHPSLYEARRARVEVLFGAHQFHEALREVDLMSAARISDASSRYLGALSMMELGRRPEALKRLEALARDLESRPRDEELMDRTTRAGDLLDAVKHELQRIR